MYFALVLAVTIPAPLSPADIYYRALARMRAIAVPAYVGYTESQTLTHGSRRRVVVSLDVERTGDRKSRFVGTHQDGSPTQDVKVATAFLAPTLFLRPHRPSELGPASTSFAIGTDPLPTDPQTIAEVHSSSAYAIHLIGIEPANGCAQAYHLELAPVAEPLRYNLRDLWVDAQTYRVCRADVERTIAIGSRVRAVMRVEVRPDGYVSEYSTTATGRMFGMPYTLTDDDLMSDPVPVATPPMELVP